MKRRLRAGRPPRPGRVDPDRGRGQPPLDAATLEERLDALLDAVLSSRRTAARPALALAAFSRAQQEFALHWASVIAKTNSEMAFQFVTHVPAAFERMRLADVQAWVIRAMDVYDRQGLYPGSAAFRDVEAFVEQRAVSEHAVLFDDVAGILEHFLRGLSGRDLKLEPADTWFTDTETLFVPGTVNRFADRVLNFQLYKAIVVHLWAQTWFGTFSAHAAAPTLARLAQRYDDPLLATRLFDALETIRLDACIERELKGLARQMRALQQRVGELAYPGRWAEQIEILRRPEATAVDTRRALGALYGLGVLPERRCYQGEMQPERAESVVEARLARERRSLQTALARLADDVRAERGEPTPGPGESPPVFAIEPREDEDGASAFLLTLDGEPVTPPEQVSRLLASILQDVDDIPEDYLVAAGDDGYARELPRLRDAEDQSRGPHSEDGALLYDEWDYRRQHYRKNWCVLRELDMHPADEPFVEHTLEKYSGLTAGIRKTFEALRGEDRLLKRQAEGDDIDLDAVVDAYGDMSTGLEMTDRLFVRRRKVERDMAVVFMVDVSGSTKGWINDAERESLVLLCEALEILGDRYAIYGFSGMTRKRCELYHVKHIDEPYTSTVRARIAGITPKDYTRMGVIIRHLTGLLTKIDARTKLLVTLSDGKPDDYDGYRGEYGIEDTRQALIEAKHVGIHPFCITIDSEAHEYLPHMYGAVNYTVIDDVRRLPLRVSEIYRRLTS